MVRVKANESRERGILVPLSACFVLDIYFISFAQQFDCAVDCHLLH